MCPSASQSQTTCVTCDKISPSLDSLEGGPEFYLALCLMIDLLEVASYRWCALIAYYCLLIILLPSKMLRGEGFFSIWSSAPAYNGKLQCGYQ